MNRLRIITYVLGASLCLAYATSLIVGVEMAEPKVMLYVGVSCYFIDALTASVKK